MPWQNLQPRFYCCTSCTAPLLAVPCNMTQGSEQRTASSKSFGLLIVPSSFCICQRISQLLTLPNHSKAMHHMPRFPPSKGSAASANAAAAYLNQLLGVLRAAAKQSDDFKCCINVHFALLAVAAAAAAATAAAIQTAPSTLAGCLARPLHTSPVRNLQQLQHQCTSRPAALVTNTATTLSNSSYRSDCCSSNATALWVAVIPAQQCKNH